MPSVVPSSSKRVWILIHSSLLSSFQRSDTRIKIAFFSVQITTQFLKGRCHALFNLKSPGSDTEPGALLVSPQQLLTVLIVRGDGGGYGGGGGGDSGGDKTGNHRKSTSNAPAFQVGFIIDMQSALVLPH